MAKKEQLTETLENFGKQLLSSIAQNPIAVITAVNEKTINCKPVINKVVNGEEIEMPEFIEVTPIFLYGGSSHETYPLAVGDYCILMISERCFDLWHDGQDFRPPAEYRFHDYSDAFALIGIKNKAGLLVIPEVITQIGDKYKEGNHEHIGDNTHEGQNTQTGDYIQEGDYTQTGDQSVSGNQEAGTYSVGGEPGVDATFPTHDGRTVTVKKGLITDVS